MAKQCSSKEFVFAGIVGASSSGFISVIDVVALIVPAYNPQKPRDATAMKNGIILIAFTPIPYTHFFKQCSASVSKPMT
ncbi:unnamed protein product [Cercopithifilaria johnstoni]|uniref:Uncharacterized protein n=1 Tax=Cercopithifilaria johnstoni TaxID=2874296 RepID=A0A8J2LWM1_9BILA|nr:unnamed protein product [Cercopithifilaria johnstoni]